MKARKKPLWPQLLDSSSPSSEEGPWPAVLQGVLLVTWGQLRQGWKPFKTPPLLTCSFYILVIQKIIILQSLWEDGDGSPISDIHSLTIQSHIMEPKKGTVNLPLFRKAELRNPTHLEGWITLFSPWSYSKLQEILWVGHFYPHNLGMQYKLYCIYVMYTIP